MYFYESIIFHRFNYLILMFEFMIIVPIGYITDADLYMYQIA